MPRATDHRGTKPSERALKVYCKREGKKRKKKWEKAYS